MSSSLFLMKYVSVTTTPFFKTVSFVFNGQGSQQQIQLSVTLFELHWYSWLALWLKTAGTQWEIEWNYCSSWHLLYSSGSTTKQMSLSVGDVLFKAPSIVYFLRTSYILCLVSHPYVTCLHGIFFPIRGKRESYARNRKHKVVAAVKRKQSIAPGEITNF